MAGLLAFLLVVGAGGVGPGATGADAAPPVDGPTSEGIAASVEVEPVLAVGHIVGDSVTAQARFRLAARRMGVSAHPGLDIPTALVRLRQLARTGHERIVLALGIMDVGAGLGPGILARRITAVLRDLRNVDCVIWLALNENPNRHTDWPERTRVFNDLLDEIAPTYGAVVQHRWRHAARNHPAWFRGDRIHFDLERSGPDEYSKIIRASVLNLC